MTEVIRLNAVRKQFSMGDETIAALDGVDLVVGRNDYVAVCGASGSGKSTMMNILGCLDVPTSGQYFLNRRDVSTLTDRELAETRNREIGFVFQSFNLLPRANALHNVMQPLVYRGMPQQERRRRASAALERVGLGHRAQHLPNQLSGGQRQRVAIARALCAEPSLLIADEPTGNLDSATSAEIMSLFDELHRDGQTLVIVTHEPSIAAHCRRNVTLSDGRVASDVQTERGHA